MLYNVHGLTSKSVDQAHMCEHSNKSCFAVLSCGPVNDFKRAGSNFKLNIDS